MNASPTADDRSISAQRRSAELDRRPQFSDEQTIPGALAPRPAVVLSGLFALCLVPRLLMVLQLEGVCEDGNYYIAIADALERGDTRPLLQSLNINIYPFILLWLHRLGLDWLLAGKLWGAGVASLAVLPMYGWIRRIFDARIAAAACFLYAIDPEMIELSVEPIREQTYWLLLMATVYLLWRAVEGADLRWFALAGTTMALAILTRSEGWFLLVPTLLWPFLRCLRPTPHRPRLVLGTALSLAMLPAVVLAANVVLLTGHSGWEWGRFDHFQKGWDWVHSYWTAFRDPGGISGALYGLRPGFGCFSTHTTTGASTFVFASPAIVGTIALCVEKFLKAIGPFNALALIIGLWAARRRLRSRGDAVLVLTAVMVFVGVWVFVSYAGSMNSRYFLTALLLLIPYAGIGLLTLAAGIRARAVRAYGEGKGRLTVLGLMLTIAVVSWCDALSTGHESRESRVALGRYLQQRFGDFDSIVVDLSSVNVCYPYRGAEFPATNICRQEPLEKLIIERSPDLVVVTNEFIPPQYRSRLIRAGRRHDLVVVDPATLPATGADFLIMVPKDRAVAAAQAKPGLRRR